MKRLLWIILGIAYVSGCGEKDSQEQPSLPEGVVGVEWLQVENERAYKLVLREDLSEDGKTLILLVNGKKSLFIGMYNKALSSVFI